MMFATCMTMNTGWIMNLSKRFYDKRRTEISSNLRLQSERTLRMDHNRKRMETRQVRGPDQKICPGCISRVSGNIWISVRVFPQKQE